MNSAVNLSKVNREHAHFIEEIIEESGQDVRKCYQCGKCSAGCPVHTCGGMDVSPNRIMRMAQLGMEEDVLKTNSIWSCVLCSTCSTRCPRNIDVAQVMDTLRIMAGKKHIKAPVKIASEFHDIFMNSIARHDRVYELGLMASLMFKTGDFFSDLDIGLPTVTKGNLPFLPPKLKNGRQIKKIYDNVKRMEGESR